MGTHPIFESDFDCLTEMLSRISRPVLNSARNGGQFQYFIQRAGKQNSHLKWGENFGAFAKGFLYAIGIGAGFNFFFGRPEGPYYYNPEEFTPDEWETKETAVERFVYKYIFPASSVAHWQTVAGYKFEDEKFAKTRLIQDVRRISTQLGAVGTWQGAQSVSKNVGGYHDKSAHIHSQSSQLLNEMIQYADEHDIKRSRDMVVQKIITEKGEGAWKNGVVVEFHQAEGAAHTMRLPAPGIAPSPHIKPEYYEEKPADQ